MNHLRYAFSLALAIVALTVVAVLTFGRISSATISDSAAASVDTVVMAEHSAVAAVDTAAIRQRLAAEDRAWRERNARPVTVAELRQRGDGTRTPRQALDDRVFRYTQQGNRAAAIDELERWVKVNPRDEDALLSLARLLKEEGRTDASIARYRQLLALQKR